MYMSSEMYNLQKVNKGRGEGEGGGGRGGLIVNRGVDFFQQYSKMGGESLLSDMVIIKRY